MFRQLCRSISRAAAPKTGKILTLKTINQHVVKADYAVRGEIVVKAEKIKQDLLEGKQVGSIKEVVSCNIGNPMELGQKPITFFRQVLACLEYPELLNSCASAFPKDVVERAQKYLKSIKGGIGAYSNSVGVKIVRDEVAEFISKRDGYPADADDIFLTDGASVAVKNVMQCLIRNRQDGILIPIPQYPLYSATLTLLGGQQCGYYLDEQKGWGLTSQELSRALADAKKKKIHVRGLVVINPGNPTGQCMNEAQMKEVVEFCHKERIVLMADEVYQTNIYGSIPFTSFKKVVKSMGDQYKDFELVSYHSVSKGFVGECGQRGGYMEVCNFDPEVKMQLYKLASVCLCSNLLGQVMVGLQTNPPKSGDESYELYVKERDTTLESLKRRALKLAQVMNSTPNVKCNSVDGAMYAFPQIILPQKFIEEAKQKGKPADAYYCMQLLEKTGIVTVPGTGFGQREGTFHLRTTILPPEHQMDAVLQRFKEFHTALIKQYS
eukprot:TRINITY_DN194_c1_g1_i1.p1 TRINITY_DN194_c1_g1~~TRINITY_DN194_c1_g1_i1.p1  ORF type:complete len:494 (-),score=140.12 TRINITY_DN194_c1_g1_i1:1424-2905(-)